MSTEPGIVFDGVWKKFRRGERHDSLRDLIPAALRRIAGQRPSKDELNAGDFWVLRDASFSVGPGECLGIIGGNGAGKSTTLKLLTGILRPTRGEITVRGRVGSLIEIAAGFHPDLSGRENVFLQGAIMGMSHAMIRKHFDEIVAFAGIEEFIDMAVKRYSSGMNARLGFAIAAHLDPDVLIIDEVLAVGDITFQQRAFGRLVDLSRSGIPVVIVSHQLDRVLQLCTTALLLERGEVKMIGEPRAVIAQYFGGGLSASGGELMQEYSAYEIIEAKISCPETGSGEFVELQITARRRAAQPVRGGEAIGVAVISLAGAAHVAAFGTKEAGIRLPDDGTFTLTLCMQANVSAGSYSIETWVWIEHTALYRGPSLALDVTTTRDFDGTIQMNPSLTLARADAGMGSDSGATLFVPRVQQAS
jgi:ABC-type polysaccharide/polyol phosphate transport system ATPase subunit